MHDGTCGRSSALKAANIFRAGSLFFCVRGRRSISSLETVRSPSTRFIVRVHQEWIYSRDCVCVWRRVSLYSPKFWISSASTTTSTMTAMTVKNVHCIRTCDLVQNYDGYHRGLFTGIPRLRSKGFNLSRGWREGE